MYARDEYRVEVRLTSFNEAVIGDQIQLTSDDYAALIRAAAPLLESHGLEAKWLLADTASMGNAVSYARVILPHTDIRLYLGLLSESILFLFSR